MLALVNHLGVGITLRQNILLSKYSLQINIINSFVEQKVVHSFDSQHIFPNKRTIQKVGIGRDTKARTIPRYKQSCKCDPRMVPHIGVQVYTHR